MLADVNFGHTTNRIKDIPLCVSNKGDEGDGSSVFSSEGKNITKTKKVNEERKNASKESSSIEFEPTKEMKTKFKTFKIMNNCIDSEDGNDGEGGCDGKSGALSEQGDENGGGELE